MPAVGNTPRSEGSRPLSLDQAQHEGLLQLWREMKPALATAGW
jgi:hypothetical protein